MFSRSTMCIIDCQKAISIGLSPASRSTTAIVTTTSMRIRSFGGHGLPFAVYVTTDFADGRGDLWWLALEKVIRETATIELKMDGAWRRLCLRNVSQRRPKPFRSIYWWLRRTPEGEARHTVAELCRAYDVDVSRLCSDLAMTWGEIRELARDPLVTIGAHTRRHYAIAPLSLAEARLEITESTRRIEAELGRPVRHFSFPYGDEQSAGARDFELVRELGFKTAVTTRKQLLHARHSGEMTGLPRVSLNGEFQDARYVKVMLSGAPFALQSIVRRVNPWPPATSVAR